MLLSKHIKILSVSRKPDVWVMHYFNRIVHPIAHLNSSLLIENKETYKNFIVISKFKKIHNSFTTNDS